MTNQFSPRLPCGPPASCNSVFLPHWVGCYNLSNASASSLSHAEGSAESLDRSRRLHNTAAGGLRMGMTGPEPEPTNVALSACEQDSLCGARGGSRAHQDS